MQVFITPSGYVRAGFMFAFQTSAKTVRRQFCVHSLLFWLPDCLVKRIPDVHNSVYQDYSVTPEVMRASDLARRRRGRKYISSAQGEAYDLEKMFAKLNRRHFDSELKKPALTWSQRRTRNILGHHDRVYDTVTISKTLDSLDVPEWFVEYILYHEMLHMKHPARLINGRRYYHTGAFRNDERRFPQYDEAQQWLEQVSSSAARATRLSRLKTFGTSSVFDVKVKLR